MKVTKNCLTCQEPLNYDLTWKDIFSLGPINPPVICKECMKRLERISKSDISCSTCLRPLDSRSEDLYHQPQRYKDDNYCLDCYRWLQIYPRSMVNHQSMIKYNLYVKEWLYKYKYQGDVRLAQVMQDLLQKTYKQYKDSHWLVLPSSPKALKSRGFHPTSLLLEMARIPHTCPFKYQGDGLRQAQKSRKDRMKLASPFECIREQIPREKHLIIFDDLYTTGATMMAAKSELQSTLQALGMDSVKINSISLARDY